MLLAGGGAVAGEVGAQAAFAGQNAGGGQVVAAILLDQLGHGLIDQILLQPLGRQTGPHFGGGTALGPQPSGLGGGIAGIIQIAQSGQFGYDGFHLDHGRFGVIAPMGRRALDAAQQHPPQIGAGRGIAFEVMQGDILEIA